jgi:hypothetical protein
VSLLSLSSALLNKYAQAIARAVARKPFEFEIASGRIPEFLDLSCPTAMTVYGGTIEDRPSVADVFKKSCELNQWFVVISFV